MRFLKWGLAYLLQLVMKVPGCNDGTPPHQGAGRVPLHHLPLGRQVQGHHQVPKHQWVCQLPDSARVKRLSQALHDKSFILYHFIGVEVGGICIVISSCLGLPPLL